MDGQRKGVNLEGVKSSNKYDQKMFEITKDLPNPL